MNKAEKEILDTLKQLRKDIKTGKCIYYRAETKSDFEDVSRFGVVSREPNGVKHLTITYRMRP